MSAVRKIKRRHVASMLRGVLVDLRLPAALQVMLRGKRSPSQFVNQALRELRRSMQ